MIQQKKPFQSIAVFLEKRITRVLVGMLTYLKEERVFEFTYDEGYLYAKKIIPLGPEFPLTQRSFRSKKLFPSLQDRIPSKENPAYPDYCLSMGIAVDETDPIILLGTIGKRGPSSFVFEPAYEPSFSPQDLRNFRQELSLTTREFSLCFDLPRIALINIENGKSPGKEILKRVEIYVQFPEVALFEIQRHGGAINPHKKKQAIKILKTKLHESQ
jgi:HipA-like protein